MAFLRLLHASVVGLLACLVMTAGPARAVDHDDTFAFNMSDVRCGYFVTVQLCSAYQAFGGARRQANAGDQFKVHATFDSPFAVPDSTTSNM